MQEVAHLVAAVVEDERAPVGVRAAARIRVLVERGAVEAGEREVVAREVRGHPVEDHARCRGACSVVDELAEVVGGAVARARREVAGDLVAPRAAERVGHHGHQLDVGEAHVVRRRRRARRPARGRSAGGCPPAGPAATSRGGPRRSTSGWSSGSVVGARLEPLLVAPTRASESVHDRGGLRAAPRRAKATGSAFSRSVAVRRGGSRTCSASPPRRRGRTAPRCPTRRARASGAGGRPSG